MSIDLRSINHYRAAEHHIAEAEYQMAANGDQGQAAVYAAIGHARAFLALAEVLAGAARAIDPEEPGEAPGDDIPQPEHRGRYRVSPGHLRRVADVYRDALEKDRPPTRRVADSFGVSHSTAAKWVGRARSEGHLEPVGGAA